MGILVSFPDGHIIEHIEHKPPLDFKALNAALDEITKRAFKEYGHGDNELVGDR